jgi:hypothetical protein
MPRIYCRVPSTGKPLNLIYPDVTTSYATIPFANAPDYSVPDPSEVYPNERDPDDPGRAILPGEIFFLTPLSAVNKSDVEQWVEVIFLTQDDVPIAAGRAVIPARDTAYIPLQGRSLLKTYTEEPADGDQLQVRASANNVIDVWVAADESPASQNIGVFTPVVP